jgi:hypothetical protein
VSRVFEKFPSFLPGFSGFFFEVSKSFFFQPMLLWLWLPVARGSHSQPN